MSIGTVVLVGVAVLVVVYILFWVLQRLSDKTYRPTAGEMAAALRKLSAGELTWAELDELSCVRITYDKRLDQMRERLNAVLEQQGTFEDSKGDGRTVRLTETGQSRVNELILEADTLAT